MLLGLCEHYQIRLLGHAPSDFALRRTFMYTLTLGTPGVF